MDAALNSKTTAGADLAGLRRAYDEQAGRMPYIVISNDGKGGFVARLHVLRPTIQALDFIDAHADIEVLRRRLPDGMYRPRDVPADHAGAVEIWM